MSFDDTTLILPETPGTDWAPDPEGSWGDAEDPAPGPASSYLDQVIGEIPLRKYLKEAVFTTNNGVVIGVLQIVVEHPGSERDVVTWQSTTPLAKILANAKNQGVTLSQADAEEAADWRILLTFARLLEESPQGSIVNVVPNASKMKQGKVVVGFDWGTLARIAVPIGGGVANAFVPGLGTTAQNLVTAAAPNVMLTADQRAQLALQQKQQAQAAAQQQQLLQLQQQAQAQQAALAQAQQNTVVQAQIDAQAAQIKAAQAQLASPPPVVAPSPVAAPSSGTVKPGVPMVPLPGTVQPVATAAPIPGQAAPGASVNVMMPRPVAASSSPGAVTSIPSAAPTAPPATTLQPLAAN